MPRSLLRNAINQSTSITPSMRFQAVRCYSASAGLGKDEITGRILDLLKNFDKVGCGLFCMS
jgi:NADH dehydrogenase (ubiquinone) 1 alpha/beta subcomplex 1